MHHTMKTCADFSKTMYMYLKAKQHIQSYAMRAQLAGLKRDQSHLPGNNRVLEKMFCGSFLSPLSISI
jgi:hypothetical protein